MAEPTKQGIDEFCRREMYNTNRICIYQHRVNHFDVCKYCPLRLFREHLKEDTDDGR